MSMLWSLFFVADVWAIVANDPTIEKEMIALQPKLEKYVMSKSSQEIESLITKLSSRVSSIQSSWKRALWESVIAYIKLIQSKRINKNVKASTWDSVSVNYSLYVMSGDQRVIYDTSIEALAKKWNILNESRMYEPLMFTLGQKQMIPGFEAGIINMYLWENKTIVVSAKDGYGEKNPELIQSVNRSVFDDSWIVPVIWEKMNFSFAPWVIVWFSATGAVRVDFNHPLAGKTLYFEVQLLSIKENSF